jgi:hypothetical protein
LMTTCFVSDAAIDIPEAMSQVKIIQAMNIKFLVFFIFFLVLVCYIARRIPKWNKYVTY